jgi:uncharacterized protein YjbI with pentapeptide repeats
VELLNQTPFPLAPLPGRVHFPKHSLTLIVKGAFALTQGAKVSPLEKQLFPTGDEFYPGDDERAGSCRYESDFAHFKPRADLLLAGACHSPGGRPVDACRVTFRVGPKQKTLMVFGDRTWEGSFLGRKLNPPAPFTSMPLCYERSFGGPGYKKNPVGRGYRKEEGDDGQSVHPLPNVEDAAALIQAPGDRPEPAGFGPLGKQWEQRRSKLGTFKGAWLKQRWPWFPEDFDPAYFNAAPADMQLEGYLRGDEALCFENLHPGHPRYEAQLPGLRVRCFLNRLTGSQAEHFHFEEVRLHLDTLWVDMDAEKLVLVWRGVADVRSEEFEEVKHAFLISEPMTQPPKLLGECQTLFQKALAEKQTPFVPEKPQEAEPAEEPPPPSAPALPADDAAAQAHIDATLGAHNVEASYMPFLTPEAKAQQARILKELETSGESGLEATLDKAKTDMAKAVAQSGIDLNNPPPLTAEAKAQMSRMLKDLGIEGEGDAEAAYLQGMALIRETCIQMGLLPPEPPQERSAGVSPASSSGVPPLGTAQQPLQPPPVDEAQPEPEPGPLSAQAVRERIDRKESLAGEDLSGLDLSGLEMSGMDFSDAILAGTLFRNATLSKANLAGVSAPKADFSGARLKQAIFAAADLTGASLNGADLTGAQMPEAILEGAALEKALLNEVDATGAVFAEAQLTGASLQKAKLDRANFTRASLHQTNFAKASLVDATMSGAAGIRASFVEANLAGLRAARAGDFSHASFRQASAPGATWKKATLKNADFSFSQLEDADFSSAQLDDAVFYAANAKFGHFTRASLRRAKLVQMNLFEGSLEKADLTGADLSGSNLYGVEFLEAKLAQTTTTQANLKMTKLA